MNEPQTRPHLSTAAQERLRAAFTPSPPASSLEALRSGAALALWPAWLPISIQGPDAPDYLHRRLTRSVRDLPVGSGAHALQLAGDARIQADLLLYRTAEKAFVAFAQEKFADVACELIDKYVLMDDVSVEPMWSDRVSFMLIGSKAAEVLAKVLAAPGSAFAERGPWTAAVGLKAGDISCDVFADGRWGVPAFHVSLPVDSTEGFVTGLTRGLESLGGAVAHPDALEYFRIERGVPAFGMDVSERTIPLEANLRDALDLGKGCFPGQEYLARINNLGHPARVLARLRFDGASPAAGDAVKDPAESAAEGGTVTSVGRVGDGEGLAFTSLPWKLRESRELDIVSAGGSVRAAVELVGEYHNATDRRPAP